MTGSSNKSARQWALRALGRRMHTVYEIRAALSKREFAENVVESVVEELARQGYIDDLNFTQIWVASRSVNQLHGRLRLLKDLRQKGIPDEIIESVLRDSFPDENEAAVAIKAAEKKLRVLRSSGRTAGKATGVKGREALYRHLRSRGFTTRAISLAMNGIKLMDSEKVHQAGCTPSVHPGAGATPSAWGGFTSLPRQARDGEPASQISSKKRSARLSKMEEDSS